MATGRVHVLEYSVDTVEGIRWSRARTRRSCCSARPAPARSCAAPSTLSRRTGPARQLNCAALPARCSRASCSATSAAPSPAPIAASTGPASSWPTAARSSSTRSASCRSSCRPSCCACSRSARFERVGGDHERRRRRPRHRRHQPRPRRRGRRRARSARTSTTGSTVVPIAVPPLRERREDDPAAGAAFHRRVLDAHGAHGQSHRSRRPRAATAYGWPGNVRELRNVLERAVILCAGRVLDSSGLSVPELSPAIAKPVGTLEDKELRYHPASARTNDGHVRGQCCRPPARAESVDPVVAERVLVGRLRRQNTQRFCESCVRSAPGRSPTWR